jgi:septal ring factor EnvC (AmiA/AmiB activator)
MKHKLLYTTIAILSLTVVVLLFRPARVKIEERITQDTGRINQLVTEINHQDERINTMQDSLTLLIKDIELKQKQITKLNRLNNEKNNIIARMSNDELVRFLTNRYK